MTTEYDAIVVGARCSGSPTAMLLAQCGYRVLLVDRATFPSDTVSTLIINPPGVAAPAVGPARRSGRQRLPAHRAVLVRLRAGGHRPDPAGQRRPATAYAPRRTVLDKILLDAAARPSAELCALDVDEAFTGQRSYDEAMAAYQRVRDEHPLPIYEFTTQMATLEPPPPEMQHLFAAIAEDQDAMDGSVSVMTGTVPPTEFLAPETSDAS